MLRGTSSTVRAGLFALLCLLLGLPLSTQTEPAESSKDSRPNFLFCLADDWSWPHAGAYGDTVIKTPGFDRLAREGVLFSHAYVASPSCTPSRAAILTGQWHWRLESAANLWSILPDKFTTYPEILQRAGYAIGYQQKDFGPGRTETPGRLPLGRSFEDLSAFLAQVPEGRPFCYWLGSLSPHRPYEFKSGVRAGIEPQAIRLPAGYPDSRRIRYDMADYYLESQRFDAQIVDALAALEERGLLENTVVVAASDNGMPFPRGKSNLYDMGTHTPLAIRWGAGTRAGREVEDFVSLTDLAPTFLELAGLAIPGDMTGRSLCPILASDRSGQIDEARDHVLTGKERHVPAQEAPDQGGYPMRAIRTLDFLYIRNFRPDRWPQGTPDYQHAANPGFWYADIDNGPAKIDLIANRERNEVYQRAWELCFGKRPAEELYDLRKDPGELVNVAQDPAYAETRERLSARLFAELEATADPRMAGKGDRFDQYPYLGAGPKYPFNDRDHAEDPEKDAPEAGETNHDGD